MEQRQGITIDQEVDLVINMARNAMAVRADAIAGDAATLEALAISLNARLFGMNVTELLIQTALKCGAERAGYLVIGLINQCVEANAELATIGEPDEHDTVGGLNMAAMRAAAPDLMVPA